MREEATTRGGEAIGGAGGMGGSIERDVGELGAGPTMRRDRAMSEGCDTRSIDGDRVMRDSRAMDVY